MRFRPCIDLHDGKVKQIVGSTLKDGIVPEINYETDKPPSYFANLYKRDGLAGGHVIMLGLGNEAAAYSALEAYPSGLQVGGGINPDNAKTFLERGASHVIVTSYVFSDGVINLQNLEILKKAVGRERLVLDFSCRKKDGKYFVVTDRWQKFTDTELNLNMFEKFSRYCDEYLIHGVDVEGKKQGIEPGLVEIMGKTDGVPITYAGGIKGFDDIQLIYELSNDRFDFTIGSALDIFGGNLPYTEVVKWHNEHNKG